MLTRHAEIGSVEAVRRPFALLSNPKENELPSAFSVEKPGRTSQKEEASLVQRERLLAAKERELAELSRAQEERHQDLEVLEMRLGEREEALKHREAASAEQKQENSCNEFEGRRAELDAAVADLHAREEAVTADIKKLEEARRAHREAERQLAASEQRLSERAGKLAAREKRVADDEGALAQLERQLRERARRLDKCQHGSADTVLEERMCQVEQRAMSFADMESAAAAFAHPALAQCLSSSSVSGGSSRPVSRRCEAVDFQDEDGNEISFRLNCNGGVDYYVNGNKDICNVDCFTRGRTLHTAGMCTTGRWSPARRTCLPEGEEGVLRKVMALFHQHSPKALHLTGSASSSSSGRFGLADVGPGEELTFTQPGNGGSRHKDRGLNRTQVAEEPPAEPAVSRVHHAQCSVQGGAKAVRFQDPSGSNSFTSSASSTTITAAAAAQLHSLQPPASWEEVPSQQHLAPRSLAASFCDSAQQRQHLEDESLDAVAASNALIEDEGEGGHQEQRRRRITARKRVVAGQVPSASEADRLDLISESAGEMFHEAAATTTPPQEEACSQGGLSSGFTRFASAIKRRVSMSA